MRWSGGKLGIILFLQSCYFASQFSIKTQLTEIFIMTNFKFIKTI